VLRGSNKVARSLPVSLSQSYRLSFSEVAGPSICCNYLSVGISYIILWPFAYIDNEINEQHQLATWLILKFASLRLPPPNVPRFFLIFLLSSSGNMRNRFKPPLLEIGTFIHISDVYMQVYQPAMSLGISPADRRSRSRLCWYWVRNYRIQSVHQIGDKFKDCSQQMWDTRSSIAAKIVRSRLLTWPKS